MHISLAQLQAIIQHLLVGRRSTGTLPSQFTEEIKGFSIDSRTIRKGDFLLR
jgi:hypothetical protein